MKVCIRFLVVFIASVSIVSAELSVPAALKVLEESEPAVFAQLNKETPTIGHRIYLERRFRGRDKQTARHILTVLPETADNRVARQRLLEVLA